MIAAIAAVRMRIVVVIVGACVAALAGAVIPTAHASTPPVSRVTVHGFLTRSAADADLLVVGYTITVQGGGQLVNSRLTTRVFPGTPVDVSTLQVDGEAVPSGTTTQGGDALTVRIGAGADSVNGGTLGNGSYLLSYEQRRPAHVAPNASTSATLTFTRNGTPGSVRSNSLQLTHPDLVMTIPKRSGEENAALLGTGRVAVYAAQLTNRGADARAVTLTVTLPVGLRVDAEFGIERFDLGMSSGRPNDLVSCAHTGSAVVTCRIGAVAYRSKALLWIPLTATSNAAPGTSGKFRVRVAPTGEPDQNRADNSLAGRVKFTGIARLHVSLHPSATTVQVGKTMTVGVQIHNNGPQPAGRTYSLLVAESAHFTITKFSTKRHVRGPDYYVIPVPRQSGGAILWSAGAIAAHHTAYARLTLKAVSAGKTRVVFYAASAAGDPGCDSGSGRCAADTAVTLRAVHGN